MSDGSELTTTAPKGKIWDIAALNELEARVGALETKPLAAEAHELATLEGDGLIQRIARFLAPWGFHG